MSIISPAVLVAPPDGSCETVPLDVLPEKEKNERLTGAASA
jgi:hypothetical protein